MAVWQFQIELVPKAVAEANSLRAGMVLTEEQRESVVWWRDRRLPVTLLRDVEKMLPSGKTWSKDLEVRGSLDTSCLTILREGESLVEVQFRFDLRETSIELLETAVQFSRDLQCWLISEGGKVIEPGLSALKDAIRESSAFQFVKDPLSFLSRLK
jgi:hypothetical protein